MTPHPSSPYRRARALGAYLATAAIVLLVGYIIGRYEMYIVALVIAIVALVASEWVARIALGMG